MRQTRVAVLIAVIALALAPGLLATSPADAQDGSPAPLQMGLESIDAVLAEQDPEAQVRAVLRLQAGEAAREDLRLVTTVYTRVDGRSALREVARGDLPAVFSAQSTGLADLAPGATRLVPVAVARAELALQGQGRAGVYPLQFQVFEGPDPVGAVLTSLIVVPEDGPPPLLSTTVLRALSTDALPALGDVAHQSLEDVVGPDAPLRTFAADIDRLVGDGSAAGVSLVASGRLLADLEIMSAGFQRPDGTTVGAGERVARRADRVLGAMRRLAARSDTDLLAYPYGPADLVALVRGGESDEAVRLVEAGVAEAAATLQTPVDAGIVVPVDGLDAATLAALGPVQADAVLLEARYLAFAEGEGMEPVRRLRTADGGEVRLLVPDADLSLLLQDPQQEGTPAVVQRLLAETAVQWLATEGAPRPGSTAVLLNLDAGQDLPPEIASRATAAIARAPWLRPIGLRGLAAGTSPSTRVVRLAYPPRSAASELDTTYVARLGQARDALGPLQGLLPEDDPATAQFADSLLAAASIAYRSPLNREAGEQRIDQVLTLLTGLTDAVQVISSAPITLTSSTGEVPVTLSNTGEVPIRLRVSVESARFAFPAGDSREVTLQPRSSQQLRFLAEALNPGGFAAITVTVDDPTQGLVLTQARISVRSTAFPVVGLIAILGSAVVLVVWGLRQSGRRRTGRHEQMQPDDAAGVA
ncbi:DUF6049 family protein [soil metagenome]